MPVTPTPAPRRGFGHWWAIAFGLVILVIGVALGGGGAWLVALGGSWYYLIAGIGLLLAGALMTTAPALRARWSTSSSGWHAGLGLLGGRPRRLGAGAAASWHPTVLLVLVLLTPPGPPPPAASRPPRRSGARPRRASAPAARAQEAADPGRRRHRPARRRRAQPPVEPGVDWPAYGGSNAALRYSPLDQITPENAARLAAGLDLPHRRPARRREPTDKYSPENTPLKVGDSALPCTGMNIVIALDAATGKEHWRFDPKVSDDAIPYGATCRGVAYYAVPGAAAERALRHAHPQRHARRPADRARRADRQRPARTSARPARVDLNRGHRLHRARLVLGHRPADDRPRHRRHRRAGQGRRGRGRALGRDPRLRRGHRPARLGLGHGRAGPHRRARPRARPTPAARPTCGPSPPATRRSASSTSRSATPPVDYCGGNRKDFENAYNSSLVAST